MTKPTISQRAISALRGRPRNPNVVRDKQGKSRGEPEVISAAVLSVRERDMKLDGVKLEHSRDRYAGFSLGRLMLRGRDADKSQIADPGSITVSQFDAGEKWSSIVHRHAGIMGYRLSTTPTSTVMLGGGATPKEPDEDQIATIRGQYRDCYNALMAACRDHGLRVRDVTYGIAVENWPLQRLSEADYGLLRIGLNSLARILTAPRKSDSRMAKF